MSSFCFSHPQVSLQRSNFASYQGMSNTAFFGQCLVRRSRSKCTKPTVGLRIHRNSSRVFASWPLASPEIASVFTCATTAVLPFYTLMVVAPKKELTKKCMKSSIPYVVLGVLYAYIVYLSWTPDTIRLLFGGKNWMPELSGIVKMFSNETTLVSVWIHLLTVDLFAARVVYNDGVENNIETRHSVCLCMLCCPIGIATHALTKALTKTRERERERPN